MNLRVMRPASGEMMKLVKYELVDEVESGAAATTSTLIHNHQLTDNNSDSSVKQITKTITTGAQTTVTIAEAANGQTIANKAIATTGAPNSSGVITIAGVAEGTTLANIYNISGTLVAQIKITVTASE